MARKGRRQSTAPMAGLGRALEVRRWLQIPLSKHVEAYATARPEDGGLGALYVLMKCA